jgi:uncharacterized protein YbjT (DUF2867 family)
VNVILFGASGMVGSGVLSVCLRDPQVASVVAIGRSPVGRADPKLREIRRTDFFDYAGLETDFGAANACYFCLGVSSLGLDEAAYTRLTYDLTLAAARAMVAANPAMTFCYVSGTGTDSSERGRRMWARVKGRTENHLLGLGFRSAYMFRPGYIQPVDGARSKTAWVRGLYSVLGPVVGGIMRLLGRGMVTTTTMGEAMLAVTRHGYPKHVLEPADILKAAALRPTHSLRQAGL